MAIDRAAIILIVCSVVVIAAILAATGVFLWLDRRRSRRIQQLTITSKGKVRDVDTIPDEAAATTSMGPAPTVTDVASTEEYHSEVHIMHHYPPPQPTYRPRQGFSAYPTPPQSIQERGVEPSPPATPPVSAKAPKAPQSIPWGRQAMNGRSDAGRTSSDATGPPPRPSIKWQTSRDRDRASPTFARPTKAADDRPRSSTTTTTTRTTPKSALPSPGQRTQPSSAKTVSFDLHEFPLPPIPIVTTDPQSAPPVLGLGTDRERERHRASTLYEPREYAYARRSFVQGGSWQNAAAPSGSGRPQPKPRRAATAPMDGFEALRLARKGSHLDIPLSAMGGGSMDSRRMGEMQMQRERSS